MRSDREPAEGPRPDPEIVLAPFCAADIPQLEKLERDTGLSFWGDTAYRRVLEELPEYFGRTLRTRLLHGEGAMVAFLLARFVFDTVEILKVAVFPEYQRQGLGSRLLEDAIVEGRKRGCLSCFLEVRASNHAAIVFYRKLAFAPVGRRPYYYPDPLEDALIMQRDL